MPESTLDIAASLLVVTALLAALNQRVLRLPPTIGLMATALALSLALVGLDAIGVAEGLHDLETALLRSIDFSNLLMQGMLSLLLFAGALHVDTVALHGHRWQVALLAFVGTAASTVMVGLGVWWLLGLAGLDLPLLHCLLFGALVSPTDPIAVLGILKSAGAPRDLEVVIAGESLFNDGVGVVLFTLLLGVQAGGALPGVGEGGLLLLREAGGGLLGGWLLGVATRTLMRRRVHAPLAVLITLAAVVGGYALAARLHVSGPLAMVVAGLVVGHGLRADGVDAPVRQHLDMFWQLIDEMLNAVLFVLVGMEAVVISAPLSMPMAIAAGVVAVVVTLAARVLSVGLPVAVFRRTFRLPPGAARVLVWGGLRGGLSIAMALSLPAAANRETLIALTYCVVAFSILVQGLSFSALVRATGLRDRP
jgi:CPA1 family monovalent cation:H+ antiporter